MLNQRPSPVRFICRRFLLFPVIAVALAASALPAGADPASVTTGRDHSASQAQVPSDVPYGPSAGGGSGRRIR